MSDLTEQLKQIRAEHDRLDKTIAALEARATLPTTLRIPETIIALAPGECYAGWILDEDGRPDYHLILLPNAPEGLISWDDAIAWAKTTGGDLPTRREQSLLFANLKGGFEAGWHWSSEQHAVNSSLAWGQYFVDGSQGYNNKRLEGRARAVRRVAV